MRSTLVGLASLTAATAAMAACGGDTLAPRALTPRAIAPTLPFASGVQGPGTTKSCSGITSVNLEDASGAVLGRVNVYNDDRDLHVFFYPAPTGHKLKNSYVHAALSPSGIPLTADGDPNLAKFASVVHHTNPGPSSYEHVIPLARTGAKDGVPLAIAAIAGVYLTDWTKPFKAWADGVKIHPPRKPEYMTHLVKLCPVLPQPPAGSDLVLVNDFNVFDDVSMTFADNRLLVQNLLNFTTAGPRGASTVVQIDCGHLSVACGNGWQTFHGVVRSFGYTPVDTFTRSGGLTSIARNVKVLILSDPCDTFTVPEVNVIKSFAAEGGRVVFVGETLGSYGRCIQYEAQLVRDLGAQMRHLGNTEECSSSAVPATALRPHQITNGMTGLKFNCAGAILLGPGEYPLSYDRSETYVLMAVKSIDLTPLSAHL